MEEKPDIFVVEGRVVNTLLRNITLILSRIKFLKVCIVQADMPLMESVFSGGSTSDLKTLKTY